MPSEDYTSVARGPLKLKGGASSASITKKSKKKKSKKPATDLEKNLSTGGGGDGDDGDDGDDDDGTDKLLSRRARERSQEAESRGADEEPQQQQPQEAKHNEEDDDDDIDAGKTEAERRFAEIKRKRLKELSEGGRGRPELLKTHKQRVEELNTALSRLSEHHDMPKIGPG